ncbi:MAG TPA: IMP dehydrogenase, partial [Spirochaetia bacterium]|nr:IMP dehydrogenase [Spirochaetia bacterium]
MIIEETLSYDDILLKPGHSDILPGETDLRTRLAGDLFLNIPILSAAMDTVTEEKLAIAIALEGGTGVIHRNLKPAEQAEQVATVKRYLNWIIEDPVTIGTDETLHTVKEIIKKFHVSGLPVVDKDGRLCGIITGRDMRFCTDDSLLVKDVMTANPIVEDSKPTMERALQKFHKHKIEKLPVIDSDRRIIGLITSKDIEKRRSFPHAALDKNGRLIVGAAISPQDYMKRIPLLMESKVDFVVLDTA